MEAIIDRNQVSSKKTGSILWCTKWAITATIFVSGTVLALKGLDEGKRRFIAANETYVSSQVSKFLNGKTFTFNDKKGVAIPASAMTREQLLFALYGVEMARRDAEATLGHIRDTVNYGSEGSNPELLESPGS